MALMVLMVFIVKSVSCSSCSSRSICSFLSHLCQLLRSFATLSFSSSKSSLAMRSGRYRNISTFVVLVSPLFWCCRCCMHRTVMALCPLLGARVRSHRLRHLESARHGWLRSLPRQDLSKSELAFPELFFQRLCRLAEVGWLAVDI